MTTPSNRNRARRPIATLVAALMAIQSLPVAVPNARAVSISDVPLGVGNASVVKPNLMFTLDDSGSMNWAFMPGEIGTWANDMVGLFSVACNRVYYDPDTDYTPPPHPGLAITATGDRELLPAQVANALYDGFADYTGAAKTRIALASFQMEDVRSGQQKTNGDPAPLAPQAPFYYQWVGAGSPGYNDCRMAVTDSGLAGKWQKQAVPGAAWTNFGNWFSYYRTRLNAMKSASARAMVEAEDGVRVGFITINPMSAANPPSVRSDKYLPIAPFEATQKTAWLTKLYATVAEPGAGTPLREALSRVGRHFAGKSDDINAGMTDDPVEFKCQPNYTLLTTDGFWDGNEGRVLDGSTWVGNQDTRLPAPVGSAPTAPMADEFRVNAKIWRKRERANLVDNAAWNADRGESVCRAFVAGLGGGWGPLPAALQKSTGFEPYNPDASAGWGVDWSACKAAFPGEKTPNWIPVRRQKLDQILAHGLPLGYGKWAGNPAFAEDPTDPGYPVAEVTAGLPLTPSVMAQVGLRQQDLDDASWKDITSTDPPEPKYAFLGSPPGLFCIPAIYGFRYSPDGKPLACDSSGAPDWLEEAPREPQKFPGVVLNSDGTLADVALYYANNSLRLPNDPKYNGPPNPSDWMSLEDRGKHQHMTTYTMGLGVTGFIDFDAGYKGQTTGDYYDLARAPSVTSPADPAYGKGWLSPYLDWRISNGAKIDDLWHAAVNGRGQYYSAADASDVYASIASLLEEINAKNAIGTGAGVTTLEPTQSNNTIYVPSYFFGRWSGEISVKHVNPDTGVLDPVPAISAQLRLAEAVNAKCDNREIFIMKGANVAPFTWKSYKCDAGGRPAAQRPDGASAFPGASAIFDSFRTSTLYPTYRFRGNRPADWDLVNYLRGQSEWEKTSTKGVFRARVDPKAATSQRPLGDIVGSQPVVIDAPWFDYTERNYGAWKACMTGQSAGILPGEAASCTYTGGAARPGVLYVGANDGMLHAFDAADLTERWAVIPSAMFPKSAGDPGMARVANTAYNLGHRFMVDGTPAAGDVFDGSVWRTILVTGFNAGGNGYFALDVTTAGAAPRPLWELDGSAKPGDLATAPAADLGRSFGNPVITKRHGDGRWVVVVSSGYNSASGKGLVLVLDAMTGAVLQRIEAGSGTPAAPVNLAKIAAYVDDPLHDNTTRYVYGGDLDGNLWRFDIGAGAAARTAVKIAELSVTSGGVTRRQPITAAPELGKARVSGGERIMVMVATGKVLGTADLADTTQQSVYAVVDDPAVAPASPMQRAGMNACTLTTSGGIRTSSCVRSTYASSWYIDLPAGERTILNPQLQLGTLVFAANQPSTDACDGGGSTWLYYVDFMSGAGVTGTANARAGHLFTQGMAQGVRLVRLSTGEVRAIITTVGGTTESEPVPTTAGATRGRRVSWREVAGD